jgi:class 3 adenylate cyclase/streptogramin lyase
MPRAIRRRLATALFVDVVGSTAIASEFGDARWKVVLARFRKVVREELRRHEGREQDTAGDGVFAAFAEPFQALSCAAALAAAVQELGLDIRAGLHTGECEEIDGKLGGIAVHVAARVMALAGAAEVVATGTTKELVAGSSAQFAGPIAVELDGVGGTWSTHRLRSLDVELPAPLEPEVAAERLAAVVPEPEGLPWRLIGTLAAGIVVAAVAAFEIADRSGGSASPPTLLRIDPRTHRVVATVHDGALAYPLGPSLWAVDGTLWQRDGTGATISSRDMETGRLLRTIPLPAGTAGFTIRFGAVWIARSGSVQRVDELSGRLVATIPIRGIPQAEGVATGGGTVWVLDQNGVLTAIDPATNLVKSRFPTGARETFVFGTGAGYLWICECTFRKSLLRYDAETRTATRTRVLPAIWPVTPGGFLYTQTWIVGQDDEARLWFLNGPAATLVPIDPSTGLPFAAAVGLDGQPVQAVLARGSIWVAAGTVVDRVVLASGRRQTIALPPGTNATGIAVDPDTGALWLANAGTA